MLVAASVQFANSSGCQNFDKSHPTSIRRLSVCGLELNVYGTSVETVTAARKLRCKPEFPLSVMVILTSV